MIRAVVLAALLLGASGSAHASGGEGGGAMTLVWQGLNLILLIAVLVYYARQPVRDFFRDRRGQVTSDLDSAAGVLSDAEGRLAEWQARADRLAAEVEQIKQQARDRAEAESARILADAEASAERVRNDAAAAVNQEVARARDALRSEAATLATKLAADLLQGNVGEADQSRLVDEFVARIESDGRTH